MIPSAFEKVKDLSDDQLRNMLEAARRGDMNAISEMNLISATPLLYEQTQRNRIREEALLQQILRKNMMEGAPNPRNELDKQLAKANAYQGVGGLEIPGMMEEQTYAHGGIVAFNQGGGAGFIEKPPVEGNRQTLYTPEYYEGVSSAAPQESGLKELSPEQFAKLSPQKQREYRDERIRQRYAAERAALGSAPKEMTPEEQREEYKKNLELARQTSEPYLKRMQELLAQTKPDQAKIEQDATKRAINMGLLSLIGAKRMPGESRMSSFAANVGEALRTGAGAYEKSVGNIDRLKREYMQSELKFVEAQNAAARGDAQSARDLANQAINDRKNAVRAYTGGLRDLGRREIEELENSFNLTAAEIRAAEQAKAAEARERAYDARTAAMLSRGSGSGVAAIKPGQYVALVQREADKLFDDRKSRASAEDEAKAAGRVNANGKVDPDAVKAILRARARATVDLDLASRGIPIPETGGPAQGAPRATEKPSNKPPEGATVIPLI